MKEKDHVVKTRVHHGSNSLDITIPTEIIQKFQIKAGDAFYVSASQDDGTLILSYERVFESRSSKRQSF